MARLCTHCPQIILISQLGYFLILEHEGQQVKSIAKC